MDEDLAVLLAQRVTQAEGYRVVDVRIAWSAATAWRVDAADTRSDGRLLLLDED